MNIKIIVISLLSFYALTVEADSKDWSKSERISSKNNSQLNFNFVAARGGVSDAEQSKVEDVMDKLGKLDDMDEDKVASYKTKAKEIQDLADTIQATLDNDEKERREKLAELKSFHTTAMAKEQVIQQERLALRSSREQVIASRTIDIEKKKQSFKDRRESYSALWQSNTNKIDGMAAMLKQYGYE